MIFPLHVHVQNFGLDLIILFFESKLFSRLHPLLSENKVLNYVLQFYLYNDIENAPKTL